MALNRLILIACVVLPYGIAFSLNLRYLKRIESSSARTRLMATDTVTNLYDDVVQSVLYGVNEALQEHKTELKQRPGLPYSLGCDVWAAGSNYTGNVNCWDAAKRIRWLSYCITQNFASESASDSLDSMLDMYIFSDNDIPHFRITISKGFGKYALLLDFIPRCDLIHSMQYFDKYFFKFDETIYTITNQCSQNGCSIKTLPTPILTKLLSSPLSTYVEVPNNPIGLDFMKLIIGFYMCRYQKWIRNVEVEEYNDIGGSFLITRDKSLEKLLLDEVKFKYAQVMGSSFAPKVSV